MHAFHRICAIAALLAAAGPAMAQPRLGERHDPQAAPVRPPPAALHPPPAAAVRPAPSAGHPPPVAVRPAPRGIVRPSRPTGPLRLDDRYHHDHYYPAPGFVFGTLPTGSMSIAWHGGSWFFHGGVWFRPVGPRYVVAVPPPGIIVPSLPPAYVSLWIGGAPYIYANGVYYAPVAQGLEVVAPPAGAESAQPAQVLPSFVVYPRLGQSSAQTDTDRLACNDWAQSQPGAGSDAWLFQRSFEACMDARGYTVR